METCFAEIENLAGQTLDRKYGLDQITRLRQNGDAIRCKLREQNITPLAVIPSEMWNRICQESKLRVFAPDSYGQVPVSTEDARYFIVAGRTASIAFCLTPWMGMAYLDFLGGIEVGTALFGTICLGFVYMLLATVRSDHYCTPKKSAFIATHSAFTLALSRIYDWLPRQRIIDRMLDRGAGRRHTAVRRRATLVMPEPPAEIIAILDRARNIYHLKLAIEPGGYSLREAPSELIRDRLIGYVQQKAKEWSYWRTSFDPIIFFEHSGMTAIIAQYGPFTIEREAVERALAAEDSN